MTSLEFDTLFGFTREGYVQTLSTWLPYSFQVKYCKPQAFSFLAGQTKASFIHSKSCWYIHRFLTYTFTAKGGQGNEVVSLNDLFILYYMVGDDPITLGQFL